MPEELFGFIAVRYLQGTFVQSSRVQLHARAAPDEARDILANHSGPMGIRKEWWALCALFISLSPALMLGEELVWALDKGYEKKRREAQSKAARSQGSFLNMLVRPGKMH